MKYSFSHYILNTDTQSLYINNDIVDISKQHYELLLFFVKNTEKVFSKNDLINMVWRGKHVTKNSIDQSVSKLRKTLDSRNKETFIKTIYGKGFMFVPQVEQVMRSQNNRAKKTTSPYKKLVLLITLIISVVGFFIFNRDTSLEQHNNSLLLIVPSENVTAADDKLNQASASFIDEILGFTDAAHIKNIKNKPQYQDNQQYFNSQWQIYPNLKIVTTEVVKKNNLFIVELTILDKNQTKKNKSFNNQNLAIAMKSASKWLANKVRATSSIAKIDSLLPDDSYITELYMRGIAEFNKGDINKAEHIFQLCIEEAPNFHLARLQLSKVLSSQGKQDKALALLETLSMIDIYPQIEIEIESLKGHIYGLQNQNTQARDLFLAVLEKYDDQQAIPQLNEIRLNLSFSYERLAEYTNALNQLDRLVINLKETSNIELLAHVLHKQASVLQQLGYLIEAQKSAEESLKMFLKLGDLIGEAKAHSALARITTHQANYKESIEHLQQALHITESLDYKIGTGATLNELIHVLLVQGQFSQALAHNSAMQKIALQTDYRAMLHASKEFSIKISTAKKEWKKSEIYLQEYLQLAQASNNKKMLLKNTLMTLDLYLDQNIIDNVQSLINGVQTHIDETQEIRLQPRINKQLARYYLLTNKTELAMTLLLSTKKLAAETKDGETIVAINNILAQQYLKKNKPQKALLVLEESAEYNPIPYPFLLLKAKANQSLGHFLKALDLTNECKRTANELWSIEDERYLTSLIKLN